MYGKEATKIHHSFFFPLDGICESDPQGTFVCGKKSVHDTYFFRYGRWDFLVTFHAILMYGFGR